MWLITALVHNKIMVLKKIKIMALISVLCIIFAIYVLKLLQYYIWLIYVAWILLHPSEADGLPLNSEAEQERKVLYVGLWIEMP